jgi:hypothetical protein
MRNSCGVYAVPIRPPRAWSTRAARGHARFVRCFCSAHAAIVLYTQSKERERAHVALAWSMRASSTRAEVASPMGKENAGDCPGCSKGNSRGYAMPAASLRRGNVACQAKDPHAVLLGEARRREACLASFSKPCHAMPRADSQTSRDCPALA